MVASSEMVLKAWKAWKLLKLLKLWSDEMRCDGVSVKMRRLNFHINHKTVVKNLIPHYG